jgi:PadR family transcriptional regulator, regulatory protein AphA
MSLRHALLGLLADEPASGYDLLKVFDRSLAFIWPATQSQLYGELNRLADDGLIEVTRVGPRGRKDYSITNRGRVELEHWILEVEPDRIRRNDALLRVFFLGTVGREQAKSYLEREAAVHENLEQLLDTISGDTDWDTTDFNRYGRLVIQSGRRYAHTQAKWAHWAASQVDALDSDEAEKPTNGTARA